MRHTKVNVGHGQNWDGASGLWLVAFASAAHPDDNAVPARVNPEVGQRDCAARMICSFRKIVAHISTFTTSVPTHGVKTEAEGFGVLHNTVSCKALRRRCQSRSPMPGLCLADKTRGKTGLPVAEHPWMTMGDACAVPVEFFPARHATGRWMIGWKTERVFKVMQALLDIAPPGTGVLMGGQGFADRTAGQPIDVVSSAGRGGADRAVGVRHPPDRGDARRYDPVRS